MDFGMTVLHLSRCEAVSVSFLMLSGSWSCLQIHFWRLSGSIADRQSAGTLREMDVGDILWSYTPGGWQGRTGCVEVMTTFSWASRESLKTVRPVRKSFIRTLIQFLGPAERFKGSFQIPETHIQTACSEHISFSRSHDSERAAANPRVFSGVPAVFAWNGGGSLPSADETVQRRTTCLHVTKLLVCYHLGQETPDCFSSFDLRTPPPPPSRRLIISHIFKLDFMVISVVKTNPLH